MPGLSMGPGSAEARCTFIPLWLRMQPSRLATLTSLAPRKSTMGPLIWKICLPRRHSQRQPGRLWDSV